MPRGKMIGGSSSMNAMLFVRGNSADYDGWAKDGAVGWSYDEVLPYFRSMENFSRGADNYRGADGPLNVTDHRSRTAMTQIIIDAAVQAGIPFNEDYNGAHQEGGLPASHPEGRQALVRRRRLAGPAMRART